MKGCIRLGGACPAANGCDNCQYFVAEEVKNAIMELRQSNAKLLKKLEAATAAIGVVPPAIRDAIANCDVEACIRFGQAQDANIELIREDAGMWRRRAAEAAKLEAIIAEVRVSNGLCMTRNPGIVDHRGNGQGTPLGEWLRDQRLKVVEERDALRHELGETCAQLAQVRQESLLEKAAQLLDSRGFRAAACVVRVMDKRTRA